MVCRCVGLLVPLVRRIAECALFLCAVPQNSKPQTGGTKNAEQKIRSTGGGNRNYRDLRRLRQLSPGCRSRLPCPSGTDRKNSLYDAIQRQQSSNTGRGSASVLFWFFQFSDGKHCQLNPNPNLSFLSVLWEFLSPAQKAVRNAKSTALYNACENNEADQILGATFDYKITDYLFFTKVECTAKGFPARVRGVELLRQQPVILNKWQKIEYFSSSEEPKIYSGPEHAVSPGAAEKETSSFDGNRSNTPIVFPVFSNMLPYILSNITHN